MWNSGLSQPQEGLKPKPTSGSQSCVQEGTQVWLIFLLFLPFSIFSLVPLISLASPFQIKDISFIQGSYRSCCQKGKVERKAEVEKLPVRSCRCSFPPDRPRQNLDFLSNKNVRKTRQLYVVYQKFVKMYNSFQITSLWIVCKVFRLSGQSLDCQDSFWIIRTVSGLSGKFLDNPNSLWIGKFTNHPGSFLADQTAFAKTFRIFAKKNLFFANPVRIFAKTFRIFAKKIFFFANPVWIFTITFRIFAKTFRIFAKTFWMAMLPRCHGFSDSLKDV